MKIFKIRVYPSKSFLATEAPNLDNLLYIRKCMFQANSSIWHFESNRCNYHRSIRRNLDAVNAIKFSDIYISL